MGWERNTVPQCIADILMAPDAPGFFNVIHSEIEGTDDLLDGLRGPAGPVLALKERQLDDKLLFRCSQYVNVEAGPRDSTTKRVSNATEGGQQWTNAQTQQRGRL